MSILNEFGFRKDARRSSQIRNIIYQTQVCRQADGSAFLQQGETKVHVPKKFNLSNFELD